jgi:hypothetical protein
MEMCVDFTDLNKACKKDDFPLERVDKIVDDVANGDALTPDHVLRISPNKSAERR